MFGPAWRKEHGIRQGTLLQPRISSRETQVPLTPLNRLYADDEVAAQVQIREEVGAKDGEGECESKGSHLQPVDPSPMAADLRASQNGEEPTEQEFATLPRVSDRLPWSAFLVAVVELAERFTYYGVNGPFQVSFRDKLANWVDG